MNWANATAAKAIAAKATWAIGAAVLSHCAAMTTAIAAETVVHVGLVRSITSGVTLDAIEKGYFKEVGIKVETEPLDTSANSIALLSQNKFDLIEGGISAGYFNGLEKDLPITMVMDRVSTPIGHNLMLRPDLAGKITDVKQLKGKVIGTNGAGSVSTYEIGKLLELGGLTIKDVELEDPAVPAICHRVRQQGDRRRARHPAVDAAVCRRQDRGAVPGFGRSHQADPDDHRGRHDEHRLVEEECRRGAQLFRRLHARACATIAKPIIAALRARNSSTCWCAPAPRRGRKSSTIRKRGRHAARPASINIASMLDMQDWYVANKFSTAKFPAERLVDSTYADYAVKKLGPFVVENKDSKLAGCR